MTFNGGPQSQSYLVCPWIRAIGLLCDCWERKPSLCRLSLALSKMALKQAPDLLSVSLQSWGSLDGGDSLCATPRDLGPAYLPPGRTVGFCCVIYSFSALVRGTARTYWELSRGQPTLHRHTHTLSTQTHSNKHTHTLCISTHTHTLCINTHTHRSRQYSKTNLISLMHLILVFI